MKAKTNDKTVKITLDISTRTAELIEKEAKNNRRSRKAQMELELEKRGLFYENRGAK